MTVPVPPERPHRPRPASVLILGSGPVVIGQAAEFDYAGTQACRALRAEGVRTILVNSNPATIMTDPTVADAVYLEPLTVPAIEAVIAREKPEGLLAGLGGQTALNLAMALAEAGVLERHDVRLLGTPLEAIRMAEDREAFRDLLDRIDQPYAPSFIVEGADDEARHASAEEALRRHRPAGHHPARVHPGRDRRRHRGDRGGLLGARQGRPPRQPDQAGHDRALPGGLAGDRVRGHARRRGHVHRRVLDGERGPARRPHRRLDRGGARPDADRHRPPAAPERRARDHPRPRRGGRLQRPVRAVAGLHRVRGDRGQPARLALVGAGVQGHRLPDRARRGPDRRRPDPGRDPERGHRDDRRRVRARAGLRRGQAAALPVRQVPGRGPEPGLPDEGDRRGHGDRPHLRGRAQQGAPRAWSRPAPGRWARTRPGGRPSTTSPPSTRAPRRTRAMPPRDPLLPGRRDRRSAGSTSAARPARAPGSRSAPPRRSSCGSSWSRPTRGCGASWGCCAGACRRRWSAGRPGSRPGSSPRWAATSRSSATCGRWARASWTRRTPRPPRCSSPPSAPAFADRDLALARRRPGGRRPGARTALGLIPGYAMVDTCAAEFAAETPYFYSTYASAGSPPEAPPVARPAALVIGSGPVRIGQGIEFDYCAVQAADVLRREGWSAVMVNSNPETVSTDFDASTRLYFEPLDAESVRSIIEFESGATGTRTAEAADMLPGGGGVRRARRRSTSPAPLVAAGVPLLGSDLEAIDQAEERTRFSALLDRLGIPQPEGGMAESIEEALTLAERIGYPVIVRPSFVIGGLAIDFAYSPEDLARHLAAAAVVDPDRPVRIDRFLEGIEVDVDAISRRDRRADPGAPGARRAGRRPLRRLDRRLPAAARGRGRPVADRRHDGAHLPRARRPRPRQRPVHRPRGRRLPDRGQPARLADRAVHVQGHRRADGGAGGPDLAGRDARARWAGRAACGRSRRSSRSSRRPSRRPSSRAWTRPSARSCSPPARSSGSPWTRGWRWPRRSPAPR